MARRSARIIYRYDGRRRIVITEAEDGLFRFIEQARRDIPHDVSFSGDRQGLAVTFVPKVPIWEVCYFNALWSDGRVYRLDIMGDSAFHFDT
jgi:hypothetical protein